MGPHLVAAAASFMAACLPVLACATPAPPPELREALQTKPNAEHGARLYRGCAGCHGPLGGGRVDGSVPRIGGQHFSVLVEQLVDYRSDRRWDPRMERFADKHHLADARAVADVAEFVSQLGTSVMPGVGTGEQLKRGTEVYAKSCRSCHGSSAQGNAKRAIPQLAGQHYEYLQRQIHDAVDGRRPNFSRAHVHLLARLDRDDIQGVADYLSRLTRQYDPPMQIAGRSNVNVPQNCPEVTIAGLAERNAVSRDGQFRGGRASARDR